ncbi:hypothetical protein [Actinoplanes sp. NPDC049802]|uniref:hypothetical protein n=1 Tax=Actinoplanes sp. NPDC049802 TaxID=3154742 RepID=UPI00340CA648
MPDSLPLDSPLWSRFDGGPAVAVRLREIAGAGVLGDSWHDLSESLVNLDTVYPVTSAAIPHLVEIGSALSGREQAGVRFAVGRMVLAGAGRFPDPPAPGLQEGLAAAVRWVLTEVIAEFLEPGWDESEVERCISLSGHRVGYIFGNAYEWGDDLDVTCPSCEEEFTVDGIGDPVEPPCSFPEPGVVAGVTAAGNPVEWRGVRELIGRARAERVLGDDPGWDTLLGTAERVAEAGVPVGTDTGAIWCLVAAMAAIKGRAGLARTMSAMLCPARCPDCDTVMPVVSML